MVGLALLFSTLDDTAGKLLSGAEKREHEDTMCANVVSELLHRFDPERIF